MEVLTQPFSETALGDFLKEALKGQRGDFHSFQAAVAFVKRSGVQYIMNEVREFVEKGHNVRMVIGIDQQGTSLEGLSDLLEAVGDNGEIWINHDENNFVTFHPKLYLFGGTYSALIAIGSGNLTQGGLYSNDEGFAVFELNLSEETDRNLLDQVKSALDGWCNEELATVRQLDESLLEALAEGGYVMLEAQSRGEPSAEEEEVELEEACEERTTLFGRVTGRRRPPMVRTRRSVPAIIPSTGVRGFVMTLMRTNAGTGQVTPGTSRRSPEIFIPLTARNAQPEFWGWPDNFTEDPKREGKYDCFGVRMRLGGNIITVNMMTWPVKHDFRLRSEALRSAGNIGDIIRIEKSDGSRGFDYYVEIVPQGTSDYEDYQALCTNRTPNSERRWGYY